jgi:hypothetical protein
MDEHSQEVWLASEKYLAMAEASLSPASLIPHAAPTPELAREWLRLNFLFPTLPEKGKTDLLSVRRYFLAARGQQQRQKHDPHHSSEHSEAMAEQAARQIREALPSFSPVQREILAAYYILPQLL